MHDRSDAAIFSPSWRSGWRPKWWRPRTLSEF